MKRMKTLDVSKVHLEKLSHAIRQHEGEWIAVSTANAIVASGSTYGETLRRARDKGEKEIVLFKVPPFDYSLVQ